MKDIFGPREISQTRKIDEMWKKPLPRRKSLRYKQPLLIYAAFAEFAVFALRSGARNRKQENA